VLLRHWIPRHVDRFDRPEGEKSCSDGVLLEFEGNAADVDSVGGGIRLDSEGKSMGDLVDSRRPQSDLIS
jgi:hypothetical protein